MMNQQPSITNHKSGLQNRWKLIAIFKIVSLGLIVVVAGMVFLWQRKRMQANIGSKTGFANLINQAVDGAILTIPYQQTLYKHFGNAINPQVELPVKTVKGYKDVKFLIDSGAVVSALPKTMSTDLGANLSELPRITIEGFAGQKTFAYKGEFVIKVGKEEVAIPVVFSENPNASNILGRIGFFDQFNVEFNAETQKIIITRRANV
ncbi:aspartyl protease family protein [Patescibacteria group bacterium]